MAALELSTPELVADWVGAEIDAQLVNSLAAARDLISARVRTDLPTPLPSALHRAATMLAARLHTRPNSIYGVDAFGLGGEGGAGFLVTDPDIKDLMGPYLRATVAFSLPGDTIDQSS